MKTVSVIIPTYKRADFLGRAIESVLGQTYPAIEVVVVDDNGVSSPYHAQTEKIVQAYLSDRVKYVVNKTNLGGSFARNAGIEASTGEYITFLDDDDIYMPDKVRVQVEAMQTHEWDMSFMDVDVRDQATNNLLDRRTHPLPEVNTNRALMIEHLLEPLTPTATYMYTRDALFRVGGFDNVTSGQEYMLMHKSINAALNIGYIRQSLVTQYLHDGERISYGANRIAGEKLNLITKKQFFFLLTKAQRREVLCRFYLSVFFTALKRREYPHAFYYGLRGTLTSPTTAAGFLLKKRKMVRAKAVKQCSET